MSAPVWPTRARPGEHVPEKYREKIQLSDFLTLSDAMSETLRCVWIVSNWSKHQSNSSIVSIAKRTYCSSPGANGLFNGVPADLFDLWNRNRKRMKPKKSALINVQVSNFNVCNDELNQCLLFTYFDVDTFVKLKKLLRTERRLAKIWANGVTIKSSPPWLHERN